MAVGGIVSFTEPNSHLYTLCTSSRFNRMLICNAGLENSKENKYTKTPPQSQAIESRSKLCPLPKTRLMRCVFSLWEGITQRGLVS